MSDNSFVDPYLDPETGVLINKVGAKTQAELDDLERRYTWARRLQLEEHPVEGRFDLLHLQKIHHQLFQDVYPWAGEIRVVNISKGSSDFIPAQYIHQAGQNALGPISSSPLVTQRNLTDQTFITEAASVLEKVNYIHPFREGNGRTQRAFLDQIAKISGRTLSWRNVSESEHLLAVIRAFNEASGEPLEDIFRQVIAPPIDGVSQLNDDLYSISPADITEKVSEKKPARGRGLRFVDPGLCGAENSRGEMCQRRGKCPYH